MILLLGAPIAAKERLASNLASDFKSLDHAQLTRDALARTDETSLAEELRDIVAGGRQIPDELNIRLLHRKLDLAGNLDRVLLSHFPKTARQAALLDALLEQLGARVECALWIELSEDHLQSYLTSIFPPVVARLKAVSFAKGALPIKTFYGAKGVLREVDGLRDAEQVLLNARRALQR